jgi:tRNA(Ile)-lysidine synthase
MGKISQWSSFHYKILNDLETVSSLQGSHWIICCSGGMDSMVLLHFVRDVASYLQLSYEVLHFHHGGDVAFRNQAEQLVTSFCNSYNISIHVCRSENLLKSEAEMRRFRRDSGIKFIQNLNIQKPVYLVTAHHLDDLIETRIIRLIRGTGPQGLKAMTMISKPWLRPFLSVTRKFIHEYAVDHRVPYLEDPSNQDTRYLRNWVRHVWLPQLEKRVPGAIKRMGHSLNLLLNEKDPQLPTLEIFDSGKAVRVLESEFLCLSSSNQGRCVALMLKHLEIKDFSQGKIQEILKQFASNSKALRFFVAGCEWGRDRTWLYARKTEKS